MSGPCLSDEELTALTDRVQTPARRRELDHLGVPYHQRRDGTLVVYWHELTAGQQHRARRVAEPNWEGLP